MQKATLLMRAVIVLSLLLLITCGDDDITNNSEPECSSGILWTNIESVGGEGLRDIVWVGDKFVAVGNTDIWTSSDGNIWDRVERADVPRDLAWSGSTIVAVGDKFNSNNPLILTSTDAVLWTEQTVPLDIRLFDVIWAGNQFVAVGDDGVVITSPDGFSWVEQNIDYGGNPPGLLTCVAWSGSEIVALSNPGEPIAIKSSNGTEWTFGTIQSGYTGALDIAWIDSLMLFVSVGVDGQIMLSQNGHLWSQAYSPTSSTLIAIRWNDKQSVIVGDNGLILTSTDKLYWTQRFSGIEDRINQVAFSSELCMWVAVGNRILISIY